MGELPGLHFPCGNMAFLNESLILGRTQELFVSTVVLSEPVGLTLTTFIICSNISADDMLYTETDLEESMDKIETINFHEVKEVAGIKFWCYHAGHVLGAAMFMIEIAGVKVFPFCYRVEIGPEFSCSH